MPQVNFFGHPALRLLIRMKLRGTLRSQKRKLKRPSGWIFAILGLRSMYFMLAAAVERFEYLKVGLSAILVLVGVKIFWNFGLKDLGLDTAYGLQKIDPIHALIATLSIIAYAF